MNESNIVIHDTKYNVHFVEIKFAAPKSGKMNKNRDLEAGGGVSLEVPLRRKCHVRCGGRRIDIGPRQSYFVGKPGSIIALTNALGTWTEKEILSKKSAAAEAAALKSGCAVDSEIEASGDLDLPRREKEAAVI